MKIDKLKKYESKKQSEITPEQIKQSREMFVNLLTPVIEKMLKSPAGIRPVHDSFESLARQAKAGIVRQPTIIVSGENPVQSSAHPTKIIMGDAENSPENTTQIYSAEELKILETLK